MQPQNALIGDATGVELPQKPEDTTAIDELKKKAKYKRSTEYGELKDKADQRIAFYQAFLPNGTPIGTTSKAELDGRWELANLIIAEFRNLFDQYEGAEALLKEEFGDGLLND